MGKKEKAAKEKPLEKMTATELRAVAMEIQGITGAHGMNKAELLTAIKKAKGIEETPNKNNRADVSIRVVKAKIKELKEKKAAFAAENNKKKIDIFRRKISRLKKKTRKAA
ncbi:MAG: Rho termination factor N-terminal domain-containing protein [Desulfobacterales bacterium]|jgi:FtsZ-binding cell division protein ZapB|nr:Rho termination factor N-terminal domain-containing protein [Desulfobacterales bacterium]